MGRVVLVTGVSRDFGGRFARRIAADPAVERVIDWWKNASWAAR